MSHIKNVFNTWLLPSVAFTWAISTRRTKHRIICNDQLSKGEWALDRVENTECSPPMEGSIYQWSHVWGHAVVPCLGPRAALCYRLYPQRTKVAHDESCSQPPIRGFSAKFWATSEKQRLSSKRTEWTGLTFCLSSLTIYNPWQILQGGGLVTFHGELRQYPSLHLQNAGFAISSAEKRSIHRTEFDENDPISSL